MADDRPHAETSEDSNEESWLSVFLGEFADPFLRLLLFAALLSGIVGTARGDLSEAVGILLTTMLTAVAATANRVRINRDLSGPAFERFRVREFSRLARGGLVLRLERLVAIIGVIAAAIASFTLGLLVLRSLRMGLPAIPISEWAFAGVVGSGLFFFSSRLWLYLLYQAAAVAGAEVEPEGVFESTSLRGVGWQMKAGFLGFGAPLILGIVVGLIPGDPRLWFSWPLFVEVQRIVIITVSIIVITVPDGLGMSVALALRLGINRIRQRGGRVRDPHLCEWFGTLTVILVDQELLSRLPAAEFERKRRQLHRIGVELRPVFTAARSLGLLDDPVVRPGGKERRLVHPSCGPGGTRLRLPYLPELDGFVVDRIAEDLPPLIAELETRGETVAWLRSVAGNIDEAELAAIDSGTVSGRSPAEFVPLARLPASGLEVLPETIREGVEIGAAIRRFLVFQLPVNLAGMLFELSGLIMGWQLPLSLVQVLWINLVMDVVAPWVLAGEPLVLRRNARVERELMAISTAANGSSRTSRSREMLVTSGMLEEILWVGLTMFLLAMGFLLTGGVGASFFALFLSMQWWNLLLARFFGSVGSLLDQPWPGRRFSASLAFLLIISVCVVQFGGTLFQSAPLPLASWVAIFMASSVVVAMAELRRRGILPGG